MKNLLTLKSNVLEVSPEALMIKEFYRIWKRDRSVSKERAKKELAYIFHTTDYQSIYRNYHPTSRETKIRLDLFNDKEWSPDKLIKDAQVKYRELQRTPSMELLSDVEHGIDKLRDYFSNVEFSEDEDGKITKNFISNVKSIGDLIKGVKTLREEVEKELTDQMQLRGGNIIGNRELPPDRRG